MESLHSVQMNSIMSIHQMSYQMDPDATPVDQLAVGGEQIWNIFFPHEPPLFSLWW